MTKEDYMKLPKERLAELLAEKDNVPMYIPYNPPTLLCNGSVCTNPFHDCINCPRQVTGWGYSLHTDTNINNK